MGIFDDEYDGVGGSYLFDPTTGKRTRVDDPAMVEESPASDSPVKSITTEEANHVI